MKKLSIIALTATAFMLSGAIAQNASMKPIIIRHENKVLRAEDATKHSIKAIGMHFWNQGWISNGAITLDLETIEGNNGFGVFSSVEMLTPDIKTEQYELSNMVLKDTAKALPIIEPTESTIRAVCIKFQKACLSRWVLLGKELTIMWVIPSQSAKMHTLFAILLLELRELLKPYKIQQILP